MRLRQRKARLQQRLSRLWQRAPGCYKPKPKRRYFMATDWVPRRRTEQLAMAENWVTIIRKNGQRWKIPNEIETELEGLTENARDSLQDVMSADRNAVNTAQNNKNFGLLIALMRNIRRRFFFVPPLTDPDLVSLGLRPASTTRTPIPAPTGQAEADVMYPGPHLLMLNIRLLSGTLIDRRADHGFRVYFGVMPTGGATPEQAASPHFYLLKPAVFGDELPHSKFTRRRRLLMELPAQDSGMTAYFSIRLESARGKAGPWGPVFSAIIP
jgi:hypothetical protein